nr:hypothetical protein [uncultured Agathobaculum sp.]
MKKVQTGIVAAALLAAIGVTSAFAAGPGWGWRAGRDAVRPACTGAFCRYADADGDGVCDVCGAVGVSGWGRYDESVGGNGVRLGCGTAGRYYTDENGDGVCDRYADGAYLGYGRGACGVYGR